MPEINVAEIITDPDFAQPFKVYRKSGSWLAGRWIETETTINMQGVITAGGTKDIIQVPEGDRTSGLMIFHSTQELFVTHNDTVVGTSDQIEWHGKRYRLFKVLQWSDFGYYKAFGTSMEGD